ncbi:MAG: hypothetical protein WDN25_17725 [Acetobacteraceae bacterium]
MPFNAPFKLGPFSVDSAGRLSPGKPGAAPAFLFLWHDRAVRARLAQADAETGRLVLQVALARVRSTASAAADGTLRPRSFTLLHWLENAVPRGWHVGLLADHTVWLKADTLVGMPITAVGLVTEITRFALELAPFLALMDEVGLTVADPGPASPGEPALATAG